MPDAVIVAVRDGHWRAPESLSDAERVALELAERVTESPRVTDEGLFERLRRYLTDAQIVELAALCAWENDPRASTACWVSNRTGSIGRATAGTT